MKSTEVMVVGLGLVVTKKHRRSINKGDGDIVEELIIGTENGNREKYIGVVSVV